MSVNRHRDRVRDNSAETNRGNISVIKNTRAIEAFNKEISSIIKQLSFIKAIHYKCLSFNNCYEPYEVISEAYAIAVDKIRQGQSISNPEAWLRLTIWNLLRNESRKVQKETSKKLSIESNSNNFQNSNLSLQEKIAALPDSNDFYYSRELKEEQEAKNQAYQRVKFSLKLLTEEERQIVDLKYIQNLSWEEVATKIDFSGKISSLRKRGERLRKKMQKLYGVNTGE